MGEAFERHRDDQQAPWNQPRKGHARKSTRTWCKGKVGRAHQPVTAVPPNAGRECHETGWWNRETRSWDPKGRWSCEHVILCATCGKVLERWIKDCPDRPEGIRQWTPWWTR